MNKYFLSLQLLALIAPLLFCSCEQSEVLSADELVPLMQADQRTGMVSCGFVKKRYGVREMSSRFEIKPIFSAAESFSEGLAVVNLGGISFGAGVRGGEWGFINSRGKFVIRGIFGRASSFKEGLAAVQPQKSGLMGYINTNGVMVIQPQYNLANDFSEGLAVVKVKGGLFGYIDKSGVFVIAPIYSSAEDFTAGTARVWVRSLNGSEEKIIDKKGNFVDIEE